MVKGVKCNGRRVTTRTQHDDTCAVVVRMSDKADETALFALYKSLYLGPKTVSYRESTGVPVNTVGESQYLLSPSTIDCMVLKMNDRFLHINANLTPQERYLVQQCSKHGRKHPITTSDIDPVAFRSEPDT